MHNRDQRLFMISLASKHPDMSKKDEVLFYNNNAIRTKEELLQTIRETQIYLCEKENRIVRENERSLVFFERLEMLFDKFYSEVEEMFLMEPLNDWWGYGISVSDTGISLKLCHFTILYDMFREVVNDYPTIGVLEADEDFTIHETSAKLLSLEEFGAIHKVASDTVRQWIRRGKIRSAIKLGNDWRIPELFDLPKRGYNPGMYYWRDELPDLPENLSFMNDYKLVHISPSTETGMWSVFFMHEYMEDVNGRKFIRMDNKQKEKFELYLIAHPLVKCSDNFIEEVYQKHPQKYKLV